MTNEDLDTCRDAVRAAVQSHHAEMMRNADWIPVTYDDAILRLVTTGFDALIESMRHKAVLLDERIDSLECEISNLRSELLG